MKHEGTPSERLQSITWIKAYLYASAWLIGWCVIAIPSVWACIFGLGGNELALLALVAGLILLAVLAAMITKRVHKSWRVAIAFVVEIAIAAVLLILFVMMALIGAAHHSV